MGKHNDFGNEGEQFAVDFLLKAGYDILERNFRYLKAEVDIIAKKDDILVIVEVKARNDGFLEDMNTVINRKKIKLLTLAADHYVTQNAIEEEVRFDLITIIKKNGGFNLEHVKNAFYFF